MISLIQEKHAANMVGNQFPKFDLYPIRFNRTIVIWLKTVVVVGQELPISI